MTGDSHEVIESNWDIAQIGCKMLQNGGEMVRKGMKFGGQDVIKQGKKVGK